jgi:hypothetical protein
MVKKRMEKSLFEEAKEVEIQTEPQSVIAMVSEVARELSYHNFYYEARQAPIQEGIYIRYNVLVIETEKIGATEKRPIGAFTLHKLNSNRTMVTVLPRSDWGQGVLTANELAILAYSGDEYDEYFCQFIKRLEGKFERYGLKVTWRKKLWCEVKDFIATIIAKFIAEKSK